tara:strand:- start:2508 stop:3383 length:876 start_codon:yes stop_codon:yes gene_type:complete
MSEFGTISSGAGAFDNFKNDRVVDGTREFLESNSLVAKTAFLLLVLIVFVLAVRISAQFLSWLFQYNKSPYLIDGMVDGKTMQVIPQDPNLKNAVTLVRSDNQQDGIEFTYSTWIIIDDLVYQDGQYRHIFHKGNDNINYTSEPIGMNQPNNAPGLYIAPNTNALVVVMNTFDNIQEKLTIDDIPLNKWMCVQIRVSNHQLDVFINGKLAKRLIMKGVPRQNYGNVYVAMNGGFSGNISDLRYFNSALGTAEIQSIVDSGPNLTLVGPEATGNKPKYLSLRWFFMDEQAGI